jgi:hypothetical protein
LSVHVRFIGFSPTGVAPRPVGGTIGIGVTGYEIERFTEGGQWTLIHTTAADEESYNNTGLSPGTQYYYRMRSVATGEASGYTDPVGAMTDTPLLPPTNVAATASTPESDGYITTTWEYTGDTTGFWIYRSEDQSEWNLIGDVGPAVREFVDEELDTGTYYYRLITVDSGEYSDPSAVASDSITVPDPPEPEEPAFWEGRQVDFAFAKLFRIKSPNYNFRYRMHRPGSGVMSTRRYNQDSWRQD